VIYDVTRGTHRRVEFDGLLTASDVEWLRYGAFAEVTLRIRTMPNTGSQVLTVSFPPRRGWQGPFEMDVDLGRIDRFGEGSLVAPFVRTPFGRTSTTISRTAG
jgi:hypothetical protein